METQETQITQALRAIATKTIWFYVTGMVALSMIFGPTAMKSGLLPITIVAGAAGGTAAVWRSPDLQSQKKLEGVAHFRDDGLMHIIIIGNFTGKIYGVALRTG